MLRSLALVALAGALMLLPFLVRTKLLAGELFVVRGNSGIIFLMGNHPSSTGGFGYPKGELGNRYRQAIEGKSLGEKDRIAYQMAWDFIRTRPTQAARLVLRKIGQFCSAPEIGNNLSVRRQKQISFLGHPVFLGYGVLLPLACLGWVVSARRERECFLLTSYLVTHASVIVAFIVLARYRLVIAPVLAVFAARGATWLAGGLRSRRWGHALAGAAAVLCIAALVNRSALVQAYQQISHPTGFRVVDGDKVTLRDHSSAGTPFGVTLTGPSTRIQKTLILSSDDLNSGRAFRLTIEGRIQRDTRWTLSTNATARAAPSPPTDVDALSTPLDKRDLRVGPNRFDIAVHRGAMRVALDDRYDFDRSMVSYMGEWRKDLLDMQTCARYRSLWFGSGELRVSLEFQRSPAEPASQGE